MTTNPKKTFTLQVTRDHFRFGYRGDPGNCGIARALRACGVPARVVVFRGSIGLSTPTHEAFEASLSARVCESIHDWDHGGPIPEPFSFRAAGRAVGARAGEAVRSANAEAARILGWQKSSDADDWYTHKSGVVDSPNGGSYTSRGVSIGGPPAYPLHVRLAAARGRGLMRGHPMLDHSGCPRCGVPNSLIPELRAALNTEPCAPPLSAELTLTLLEEMGGADIWVSGIGVWYAEDIHDEDVCESNVDLRVVIAELWLRRWATGEDLHKQP